MSIKRLQVKPTVAIFYDPLTTGPNMVSYLGTQLGGFLHEFDKHPRIIATSKVRNLIKVLFYTEYCICANHAFIIVSQSHSGVMT